MIDFDINLLENPSFCLFGSTTTHTKSTLKKPEVRSFSQGSGKGGCSGQVCYAGHPEKCD